jgi:hypothetical protein
MVGATIAGLAILAGMLGSFVKERWGWKRTKDEPVQWIDPKEDAHDRPD